MTTTDPTTSAVSGYTTRLDPNRRVSLSYRSDGRYLITGQTGAETRRMGLTEEATNQISSPASCDPYCAHW